MENKPKKIESKIIHDGWLSLKIDKLEMLENKFYDYEVVKIGDGVAILPFINDDELILAKQYRHPVSEYLLELIQGGISRGETIVESAARELLEETGYVGDLTFVNTMYPLPGSLDMRLHFFTATNMKKVQEPKLDDNENLELIVTPYEQVLSEVMNKEHKDSALVWAMLNYEIRKNYSNKP